MSRCLRASRIAAVFSVFWLGCPVFAEVVIHEIHYHPAAVDGREPVEQEFIELFHTSGPPVNLQGWRFVRGVQFTFPEVTLRSGEYLVAAADPEALRALHGETVSAVGGWTGQLSNSGETLELVDAAGRVVDEVAYADEGDWAARRLGPEDRGQRGWVWVAAHDGDGPSMELVDVGIENEHGGNWASSAVPGGTPGRRNSVARESSPPILTDVRHMPAVPRSTEEVHVEARVTDDGPDVSAVLSFRVSSANPGEFLRVAMNDAGTSGDLAAGDGVFTGKIPPLANRSVVEFYVEAANAAGLRTWPAPASEQGEQLANALYQVEDGVDPSGLPVYRLILSVPEDLAFRPDVFARQSDAEMNSTFLAGRGAEWEVRYLAGVRYRGNSSRGQVPPTLRVDLAGDRPWNGETALNLNSRSSYLQALGMETFHRAGLPAPEVRLVRLRINGVEQAPVGSGSPQHYGAYVHMQPVNAELVRAQFPEDDGGNLYRKRSADPSRDRKRWGVHFGDQIVYRTPDWYRTDQWTKLTNDAANDWSDLQDFIVTVNEAPPETYLEDISARVHLDQWLRWFALMVLMNNRETNLSNGIDDDYFMYAGELDRRFTLLPHDLDTVFGGDPQATIFPMLDPNFGAGEAWIPQLAPFFEHPVIRRGYFRALRDLLGTVLSEQDFRETVGNLLGDIVPLERREEILAWMRARNAYVLGVIDPPLELDVFADTQYGFRRTTDSEVTVRGRVAMMDADAVRVNGLDAELEQVSGLWILDGVPLFPGINRIVVEALDEQGVVIEADSIDVWRVDGDEQLLEGFVNVDRTLTAAGGPYRVRGTLVVPAGRRLTIEAGASLFFEGGAELKVLGELSAMGQRYRRIRFSSVPDADWVPDIRPALPQGRPKWKGIHFEGSLSEANGIAYADIVDAQDPGGSVGLVRSRLHLSHASFSGTRLRMVYAEDSAGVIENSRFPDMFGPGEDPDELDLDNVSEHVKMIGRIPAGQRMVIRGNRFGTNRGHNDVIDADSGQRPGPIIEILDNVFTGVGDELLDLGGDAFVAGNFFARVSKDESTSDRGYASAISQGDGPTGSTVFVNRNVFWDVDHAVNVKNGAATVFENNTVVRVHPDFHDRFGQLNVGSAINLFVDEPGALTALGAYAGDNLFVDLPRVFGNVDLPEGARHLLRFSHNLIPPEIAGDPVGAREETLFALGEGNRAGDPYFEDGDAGDFRLAEDSPARGAGSVGQDLGAMVEPRMYIAGEPVGITDQRTAVLRTGGPGMAAFQHRVNGGPWSLERELPTGLEPEGDAGREALIELTGLAPGEYVVEVRGRDFAGNLQEVPTGSRAWTVGEVVDHGALRISEVLADNAGVWEWQGLYPDFVEIHNGTGRRVDLSGMTLSDDPGDPGAWSFPEGTRLEAGEYLVLPAGVPDLGSEAVLPFALDKAGEGVFLYEAADDGGDLLDSVVFGLQIPDYSIARAGPGAESGLWTLCRPTPGGSNAAVPTGSVRVLRINEWLASSRVSFRGDFAEIYNPAPDPVRLGGLFLTDDPLHDPERHRIRDLSYVAPGGFAVFEFGRAVEPTGPASDVEFGLSASYERLALVSTDGTIDEIMIGAEVADVSRGRAPDGSSQFADFRVASPGIPNSRPAEVAREELVAWSAPWRFDQSDQDFGFVWKDPEFDDSASWAEGPGAFYVESGDLPVAKATPLQLNPPQTHYFRSRFDAGQEPWSSAGLELLVDDGAVVWLNGEEILRPRMPDGVVGHGTFASSGVGNAVVEGPFAIEGAKLRAGENLLAVEVHQDDDSSSDVVFAARLVGERVESGDDLEGMIRLLDQLRITELMVQPAGEEPLEFVELQNVGPVPVSLEGVRFVDGIQFVFPEWILEPGAYVLVVQNAEAFAQRYGDGWPVIGEYGGRLANEGERIRLMLPEPFSAAILDFRYDASWYAATAGGGYSLTIPDPSRPAAAWDDGRSWLPSPGEGGTPGRGGAPAITSPLSVETVLGDLFAYRIEATNDPEIYRATGLPAGLQIETDTGWIRGAAEVYGLFIVEFEVANAVGSVRREFLLRVSPSGPAERLEFDALESVQESGISFPVGVRVVDAAGRTVADYESPDPWLWTALSGAGGSAVRITEIGDRDVDFVEFQNTGSVEADTTGWTLLFNDASNGLIGDVHGLGRDGVVFRLEGVLQPGEVRLVTDDPARSYLGANLSWNHVPNPLRNNRRKGWAMLLDDQGAIADLIVWGYSEAEIASLAFEFEGRQVSAFGAWQGGPAEYADGDSLTLQRRGTEDRDRGEDWEWIADSSDLVNPGIALPLVTEPLLPLRIVEDGGVKMGQWTGAVRLDGVGPRVRLSAADAQGLRGESGPFELVLPQPPVITSPLEVEAVAGEPFHYRITGERQPVQFAADGLPEALYRDDEDPALIRGIPEEPGVAVIEIAAANAGGETRATLRITVLADSDGDGMPDQWETVHGLDPEEFGRGEDSDADGSPDWVEYRAGTDPGDPGSAFRILEIRREAAGVRIVWNSRPGRRYRLWSFPSFGEELWEVLRGSEIRAAGVEAEYLHKPSVLDASRQLYRVEVLGD